MAWFLLASLDGSACHGIRDAERARIRSHVAALQATPDPARELAEKVSSRALLRKFSVQEADVTYLRADSRLQLSSIGVSGSGTAADMVEGYVAPEFADSLINDYRLQEASDGNVRLRIAQSSVIGKAVIAADLADWSLPRETQEANRILGELLHDEYRPAVRKDRKYYVSLALHKAILKHLESSPESVIASGTEGITKALQHTRGSANDLLLEWDDYFRANDIASIRSALTQDDERSVELRNVTPFYDVLSQDERSTVVERVLQERPWTIEP